MGSMVGASSNPYTRSPSTQALDVTVKRLLSASLAPATRRVYRKHLQRFNDFVQTYFVEHEWPQGPVNSTVLAKFIAHLSSKGYSPSTILSNVSAVSFVHKINDWSDPACSFFIKKLLLGARKLSGDNDSRLPITVEILEKLIGVIPQVIESHYVQLAMKAMFSLAFFGLLRVGEFTSKKQGRNCKKVIQQSDVCFDKVNSKLLITLRHFKHSSPGKSITLELQKQTAKICPVTLLRSYLKVRKGAAGPLFVFPDMGAITTSFFNSNLKIILEACGFSSKYYKAHSFRIGGATIAAIRGASDVQIQAMGRWKSSAYKKYIRIPTLSCV